MEIDMGLREKLLSGEKVITAEISPPRGTSFTRFDEKAKLLKGIVDAVNVTDNQGANMRLSSFGGALRLMHFGIEPIMQMTCRDRNVLAMQSDLLTAYAFGIKNILALGGDKIEIGDHPKAKPVYDVDAVGLMKLIQSLNKGESLSGKKLNGGTDFFIGGVHNISAEPINKYAKRLFQKIDSGARFFQTQPVFSPKSVEKFYDEVTLPDGIFFILGILVPTSTRMIDYINANIPEINIPNDIRKMIERANDPIKVGIDIAVGIIKELWDMADGFHIMAIYHEDKIPLIVEKIR